MADTVINVWDLIEDPDCPSGVVQRAFARQRARALGVTVPEILPEDLPHLARHAKAAGDRAIATTQIRVQEYP